jgi:hypothetical protein
MAIDESGQLEENQMNAAMDPKTAELLESPFFVLDGPAGPLSCQWTAFNFGKALSSEFEILCPERPELTGCLFGLFDQAKGEFRMRPEVKPGTFHAVDDGCQDLDWRGSIDDVSAVGHDWDMGEDGLLFICDPEEPAADPAPRVLARLAA